MKRHLVFVLIALILLGITVAYADGGFTIKPIDWDTAVVGQYALPDGYKATRVINNCDENSTLGHPIRVSVILNNKKEDVRMQYYCGEDYIDRVYASNKSMQHVEGGMDYQTMSIMHRYVNADGYCDELARQWAPNCVYWKNEDMSACTGRLSAAYAQMRDVVAPGLATLGYTVDAIEASASQRVYNYSSGGKDYCICVMTEVYAYKYSANTFINNFTNITWSVPCYYILWCPMESYERIRDGDFAVFVENTSVNDEMEALNARLTENIAAEVIQKSNMMCAASSAYMQSMTALTFSMVESNMSYSYTGSYSSDRFSDYLFDENDYTLSDGSSVKVSTAYNYVWEGSNGSVYYGNSLSDAPGGSTLLYANH